MKKTLLLTLPLILTACAGGGTVSMPETLLEWPKADPIDMSKKEYAVERSGAESYTVKMKDEITQGDNAGNIKSFNTGSGNVIGYTTEVSYDPSIDPVAENRLYYQTSNGNIYIFDNKSNIILPTYATPSEQQIPTSHRMLETKDGKLLAPSGSAAVTPTYVTNNMQYGAWASNDGETNLFVGGVLADASKMKNAEWNDDYTSKSLKGKAIYYVLGLRVKDGQTVSSTFDNGTGKTAAAGERSYLVANFDTGKLGGVLIGNKDFGDSIDMRGTNNEGSVNIKGVTFEGTAVSGSAIGKVQGAFFGEAQGYYGASGTNIGGTVTFDDKTLNASFGGYQKDYKTSFSSKDSEKNTVSPKWWNDFANDFKGGYVEY